MSRWSLLPLVLSVACVGTDPLVVDDGSEYDDETAEALTHEAVEFVGRDYAMDGDATDDGAEAVSGEALCNGEILSNHGAAQVVRLT